MDRLLRYVKDIERATLFDIQNVSDYFWTNKNEYSDLIDMNLAPPYPFFATRYEMPQKIYSDEKGWTERNDAGTEILTAFRALKKTLPGIKMKWFYDIMMFAADRRRIIPMARWTAGVDELGRLAKQPDGDSAFWITTLPEDKDGPPDRIISYLHVSGLALTFLNCRNIVILPAYADKKRRKARKRPFLARYHRLKINAVGQRRESEPGQKTGIKRSLHIVRGHFREYGPEFGKGKLFGRLSGRFWVAARTAGDAATGIVTKDYEIEK